MQIGDATVKKSAPDMGGFDIKVNGVRRAWFNEAGAKALGKWINENFE